MFPFALGPKEWCAKVNGPGDPAKRRGDQHGGEPKQHQTNQERLDERRDDDSLREREERVRDVM